MVLEDLDHKAIILLLTELHLDQIELLTQVVTTEDLVEPVIVADHRHLLEKAILHLQDQLLLLQAVVVVVVVEAAAEVAVQHVAEVEAKV